MAKCKNCSAELVEGAAFCEACGASVAEDKPDKKKKRTRKSKKEMKPASVDVPVEETLAEEAPFDLDTAELPETPVLDDTPLPNDAKSIEDEAKDWASNTAAAADETTPAELPASDYAPDKRVVPSAVFIARTKNGVADKFFGLLLFAVVLAIIVMAFVLNNGLFDAGEIMTDITAYVPLLVLMLGALVIARTGSFDLGLPVITVITYLLLTDAYANQNIYPMMIACLVAAVGVGLILGVLTVVGKVPAVFSSVIVLIAGLTYISVMFASNLSTIAVPYVASSITVVPIILIAVAIVASFVLIYMTKLGRPLFKRKGLTNKNRLLYVLAFGFAYMLAAGAGIVASVYNTVPLTLNGALFSVFDLVLGLLFIIALSGASTLFDNRSMPVLVALLSFIAWFGVLHVLNNSSGAMTNPAVAAAIKVGFVLLALIADRVYTTAHFADFHQTINVKK